MLPKLIIIGAMKCGTTSLYRYLAAQKGVVASRKKETDFFLTPESFEQGLGWYEDQFSAPGVWAFESSPNYTKRHLFPGVPERIARVVPDVHLVYIVRDPIKRAISHYVHSVSRGRERRALADALLEPASNYLLTSLYHYQLSAFLDYFPPEQVTLIDFDQLVADPRTISERLMAHCETPGLTDTDVLTRRFNDSTEKLQPSWLESYISRSLEGARLNSMVRRILRPWRQPIHVAPLTDAEANRVLGQLQEDMSALRALSGQGFPEWSV